MASAFSPAFAAETSFDKGVVAYKKGHYDEAVSCFRSAAQRRINTAASIYYLAMSYQQLNKMQEAHDSYKLVCTDYPNSPYSDRSFAMMKQLGARLQALETAREFGRAPETPVSAASDSVNFKQTAYATAPSSGYVLKYTEEAMDGRMYIDGTIDGRKCKILFDTGSGVTFCRQSFVNKNNWQFNWTKENAIVPGAFKETIANVAVARISLGSFVRDDKIYVEQDSPDSLYASYDNCPIVGQSFFGDLTYEIDTRRKVIVLKPTNQFKSKNEAPLKLTDREVPFTRDGHHIVVKARVNNRECEMYLDTGASQVVFADRHLAQCGLNRPVEATNTVRRTVDGRRDSYAFTVDSIKLGHIEKKEVNAAVLLNTKFSRPLLGQSFLEGLRYTVDPSRNVIRFDP
jgi:clan AA aspartic protease (TIGR02281 family)